MSVPAISLYATPPECDLNPRYFSSYTASSSYPHKPAAIIGGLSRLFATPPAFSASFEDLRHDSWEEIKSSFCYKSRDQSPVSAFHFPISCGRRSPSPLDWSFLDGRGSREDLLKCFVGNALSSCLDYNSSSFPVSGGFDDDDAVDLTFNLEEGFTEGQSPSYEPFVMKLLSGAQSRHEIFHEEMVKKAFFEAEKAHRGQRRMSGDPYLQHCVETAVLLALIGANTTVVAAGLLHDTIDDSFADYNYILTIFGAGVADLVEEVSKLSQLSKLSRESNTASRTVEADRLHTIYLAMADARAVLIKLADRLHNMMTLEVLPEAKQQRFAKETLEIFAPLANRLGISSWKEQLENICFKYLHPEEYNELSCKLLRTFDEAKIMHSKEKLEHALKNCGLSYHVLSGRHKSLFGIYSKMIKKKLTMDEIHDIHGLRLIVEEEEDCYRALNIVHQLWPDILGRLKDYITHPKDNGYQSLHTVVMSEDKLPLEVQIRTKEMHLQAECGFAAHWRYKEGDCKHSSYILQMVEWARWVMTWQCEMIDAEKPSAFRDARSGGPACSFSPHRDDYPYSYAVDEPVFIIMLENEKMSVQEFAPNSTVMDLLERFGRANRRDHLNVFAMKEELRPRLNHEHVSEPTQKLRMGDVVELTPAIPRESLTEYREEIKRMYDRGLSVSLPGVLTS